MKPTDPTDAHPAPRRGPGRPPLPPGERLEEVGKVRLRADEALAARQAAEREGVPFAAFVRAAVVERSGGDR